MKTKEFILLLFLYMILKYGTKFIYGEGEVESRYSDKIYRNEIGIINII